MFNYGQFTLQEQELKTQATSPIYKYKIERHYLHGAT